MSVDNVIWRKYGLKDNPYFHYPLTVEEGKISLRAFVGRGPEKCEIEQIISIGGDVRFMITGEAGVGKTTLVNYVRARSARNRFFTPQREIEINKVMTGNEFIILTISSIYMEIKRQKIPLQDELLHKLEALYELTRYGELTHDIANIVQINSQRLRELFEKVIEEIIDIEYKGIVIHYDNLDNIEDFDGLVEMFSEVRDFLFHKKVIFLFVGDTFLPQIMFHKRRLSQIFLSPSLEVKPLDYKDIVKILDKRIEFFSIPETIVHPPHTEEAVELLFNIHNGNIRDILNSLTACIISLPPTNTPIQISKTILVRTLHKKAKDKIISNLTEKEKGILAVIRKREKITPSEIANMTGQKIQNISSYYLKKLKAVQAIRERGREGRNVYYEVTPIIKWLDLEKYFPKKVEKKQRKIQLVLKDFF